MSGKIIEMENRGQSPAAHPAQPLPPMPVREDELDLRKYWHVIMKHRWAILGITALVTLISVLFVMRMTPIYTSTATVMIESNKPKVVSIEEIYGSGIGRWEYYQTQFEILKSRELAAKVVERLKLYEHPLYAPAKKQGDSGFSPKKLLPDAWRGDSNEKAAEKSQSAPEQGGPHEGLIGMVMGGTSITPVRDTQLVKISFHSPDAKLAALVPNALADLYIESDLESRMLMTRKAAGWLTERLSSLRQTLEKSEKALQEYRERQQLVDVKGVQTVTASQLSEISSRLVAAQQKYRETVTIRNQVRGAGSKNMAQLQSIPAVLNHPLVLGAKQNEAEAQQRVSELKKRYGPKHPNMIAAQSELDSARANVRSQIRQVVDGIEKEYQAAFDNAEALKRELARIKGEAQTINRKEYDLNKLERDVETNRELYNMFLTRFKETDVGTDFNSAIARVIDPAIVPRAPSGPNKRKIVTMVFVITLLMTIGLAFVYEQLDNTFKGTDDVEERLGLAVLGALPHLQQADRGEYYIHTAFQNDSKSVFAEAVRTIRTGLMLSSIDEDHKVVLVTSTFPGEGKSTLTMNLGLALAHMGKTLIIDADMRRPVLSKVLGLDIASPGLSGLVAGTAKLSECVHTIRDTNLHVMHSGVVPPNPLELLSSERFNKVITHLQEIYDWIIIDSAPLQVVSDALVLASKASSVVYVVNADSTPYQPVQRAIKRLRDVNAPLLGVTMNHVEYSKDSKYYYGKYGKYGYGKYGYYDNKGYGYHSDSS
jgi:capsular exopolysaccharide synthesis family protein